MKNQIDRTEDDSEYAPEHPQDRDDRHRVSAVFVREVDTFSENHQEALKRLLWIYSDGKAEKELSELREKFYESLDTEKLFEEESSQ